MPDDRFVFSEPEEERFIPWDKVLKGDKGEKGDPGPQGPKGDPGNYTKPDTGIPKTDLASDVQTSLNKANTIPAGGTDGDVLVKNGAADYAGKWTNTPKLMGRFATIESSPAVHAYAKGDYLVYNGQLYKVTAAISPGSSLTPGSNIAATTAGIEIKGISNHLEKPYNPAGANNVSLATLKTSLISLATNMATAGINSRLISFTCTDSPFFANIPYIGYFTIYTANYFEAIVSSYTGNVVHIGCTNGGSSWSVKSLTNYIGGVDSVTNQEAGTLLQKRIDLPSAYSAKLGSEYAVVVTSGSDGSATRWFVLKNTGYFVVYERTSASQAAGTSHPFNYVVVVN